MYTSITTHLVEPERPILEDYFAFGILVSAQKTFVRADDEVSWDEDSHRMDRSHRTKHRVPHLQQSAATSDILQALPLHY